MAEPASATAPVNTSEGSKGGHGDHIRLSHVQIDVLSGICAGIVSNIVSHPLDTVKVRMQLGSTESVKIIPTVKTIYHREGVSRSVHDLYYLRLEASSRVSFSQFLHEPPFRQCKESFISPFRLFSALGFAKRRLEHHPDFGQNTKNFLAGAFAGL